LFVVLAFRENETKMKNMIRRIKKVILIYMAILASVFFLLRLFLNSINLEYRQWVVIAFTFVLTIGANVGIAQLILKIKRKWLRVSCIAVVVCIFAIIIYNTFLTWGFSYGKEYTVEKNGYKLLAHVNAFLETTIYYYDYKNPFVQGKKLRLYEWYGNGAYDPFDGIETGFIPDVKESIWYDDNGKRIIKHLPDCR